MVKRVKSLIMLAVTGLLVSLPVAGFSQDVTKSVTVNRDSKIGSSSIASGTYTIKYAEGKDGEAVLLKGKKEVVKSSYRTLKLDQPAAQSIVVYKANGDGSLRISRIEFKGVEGALVFD